MDASGPLAGRVETTPQYVFMYFSLSPSDTLDGKLGGIMIDADIDKAALVDQIVDPLGDRLAISQGNKDIHVNVYVFPFGLPFRKIPKVQVG